MRGDILDRASAACELWDATCDVTIEAHTGMVAAEGAYRDAPALVSEMADEIKKLRAELDGARETIRHQCEAMSWIAGHDRQGLDHLEEAMAAAAERDAAEAEVRELRAQREPRRIETVEELDALPKWAVVQDVRKTVWEKESLAEWFCTGNEIGHSTTYINLPATVLYTPEVDDE